MKVRKSIACFTAAVLSLSAFPVLSASAEESAYALGDVDMDGVITGHDAAMVSRYVLDDDYSLTEEALQLADVNGDGEVNQADADWIYANKKYALGSMLKQKDYPDSNGYGTAMCIYALEGSGYEITYTDDMPMELPEIYGFSLYNDELSYSVKNGKVDVDPVADKPLYDELTRILCFKFMETKTLSKVEYNLVDADANGIIDMTDIYNLMLVFAMHGAGYDIEEEIFDGVYYLNNSMPNNFTRS